MKIYVFFAYSGFFPFILKILNFERRKLQCFVCPDFLDSQLVIIISHRQLSSQFVAIMQLWSSSVARSICRLRHLAVSAQFIYPISCSHLSFPSTPFPFIVAHCPFPSALLHSIPNLHGLLRTSSQLFLFVFQATMNYFTPFVFRQGF